MKDSYSFDIDAAGLKAAYHAHREAYQRIFDRLRLRYVIVSAVSGAMGGSASEEFLAESPSGEDTFVRCLESGYAANVEAVITARARGAARRSRGRAARGGRSRHRQHPDHRQPGGVGERGRPRSRRHRGRHVEKRAASRSVNPAGSGNCWPSGCPATAKSTTRGWARHWSRPSMRCSATAISPSTPSWSRAISGRRHCGTTRFAILSTRGWSTAPAGSPAPTSRADTSSVWWPAATSPPTAPSRPPRCARAIPLPTAPAHWSWRAESRSGTSSSWAANTPMPSPSTCSARTASRCG